MVFIGNHPPNLAIAICLSFLLATTGADC